METTLPTLPTESGPSIVQSVDPNTTPVKRKPGRPKGSGKKQPSENSTIIGEKIKRPVGRPRKDGLPAGSVGPRRSAQSRKSSGKARAAELAQGPPGVSFPGTYYSQHPGIPSWQSGFTPLNAHASVSAPPLTISNGVSGGPPQQYHLDPNLNKDEWEELLRTKPDIFLQTLLATLAAPNPLPGVGPTVQDAFKSHLASLAPSTNQTKDTHSIPSLYSVLKTFWLPSSPAYLSLIASGPNSRTLSEHRFFYWDPLPLVFNGIPCSVCSSLLTNRGRIKSGPIKVYDLEKPFFIIGCEYVCKSSSCVTNATPEGRRFASTDASIMQALPTRLKEEFPAMLLQRDSDMGSGFGVWNWHAMGVSKSLWNMVKSCLKSGMPKDGILHVISAIQSPLKDDREKQEEEEEEMPSEDTQGISSVTRPDNATLAPQDTSDEYDNAWKANSATAEAGSSQAAPPQRSQSQPQPQTQVHAQAQSQPSSSTMPSIIADVSAPSSAPTQPAPYTFTQAGPYVSYPYGGYPYFTQPSQGQNIPPHAHPDPNGLKRPFGYSENASEVAILEPSQKRTRHCCKCGSQDCKGKGGRTFCLSACQDCGKTDCRGRNSRRPDKVCSEAWV